MYAVVGLGLSGTMTTSFYNGLDETDYDHCDYCTEIDLCDETPLRGHVVVLQRVVAAACTAGARCGDVVGCVGARCSNGISRAHLAQLAERVLPAADTVR